MNMPMDFGEPIELADGVFCIPTDYPAVADAPLWTHLVRGDVSTLIDCGVPTTYDAVLAAAFAQLGMDPREIAWLLLTHAHPDHMGGHGGLREHTAFSVAAPLEDVIWAEAVERQWHEFWDRFPGTLDVAGIRDVQVDMCGGDLPVDRVVRDGEILELGGRSLRAVQTRGHTRGHCAYLEERTGILFSGDSVQGHGIRATSGRSVFAPMYEDVADSLAGLERLRALPFTLLAGAHFAPLERDAGLALIDDSIAFVHETDALVRDLLAGGGESFSAREVAAAIGRSVGTDPPQSMQTIYTAHAHLTHAARAGLAEPRWLSRSTV